MRGCLRLRLKWLAATLGLVTCTPPVGGPEELPFEVVEESEYLCLGIDFSESACAANVSLLDAQVAYVASFLGLPLPDACIPALWTPYVTPFCRPQESCYRQGVVYSDWRNMPGALVHAVLGSSGLEGPWFLREGLAEALSGRPLRSHGLGLVEILEVDGGEHGDSPDQTDQTDHPDDEVESAGHLIAWLLENYGAEAVVGLYASLEPDAAVEELLKALEERLETSRSSLGEAYALASGRVYAGKGPFACGATAVDLPWTGARITAHPELDCDSGVDLQRADLAYVQGHTYELWRAYRTELPAGMHHFELGTIGYRYAVLQACLESDIEVHALPEPSPPALRSWEEGRRRGLFQWEGLPEELAVPGGVTLALPAGIYTLWLGWIRDPAPNVVVPPTISFGFERLD